MPHEYKARSVAVHPEEDLIVVGFYDGSVEAFTLAADYTLKSIRKWKACKEWVSEIKFSPNKAVMAVGSHDNAIYLYAVKKEDKGYTFTETRTLKKHSSYITHLDFSVDS